MRIHRAVDPKQSTSFGRIDWERPDLVTDTVERVDVYYPDAVLAQDILPGDELTMETRGLTCCAATVLGFVDQSDGRAAMYLGHFLPTLAEVQAEQLSAVINFVQTENPEIKIGIAGLIANRQRQLDNDIMDRSLATVRSTFEPDEVYDIRYESYADVRFSFSGNRFSLQMTF